MEKMYRIEVVLVQCNLVDNHYERKSEVLYTFMPNKSYAYLLEYSDRFFMTSESLWNYCSLNTTDTTGSRSFEYKTKILEGKPANINTLGTRAAVPLKYLNNFWRSLDLPLLNY